MRGTVSKALPLAVPGRFILPIATEARHECEGEGRRTDRGKAYKKRDDNTNEPP